MSDQPATSSPRSPSLLDRIESLGNKLPEPILLFAALTLLLFLFSALGDALGWSVQPVRPILQPLTVDGVRPPLAFIPSGDPITPRNLATSDGLYWLFSSMVRNFTSFPALGLVFVAMVGIGAAEKFGLFAALMRAIALAAPAHFLTPIIIFIGASSSIAADAGLVILPPLAAALFLAAGRHPIAGLAAAFAGVSGGFGAGVFPTAADGFLAGVATPSARIIDPAYHDVLITHNLFFKIGSAVIITLVGWLITDRIIEPRLLRDRPHAVAPDRSTLHLQPHERRGLRAASIVFFLFAALTAAAILIPGAPLHGKGQPALPNANLLTSVPPGTFAVGAPAAIPIAAIRQLERPADRWSQAIVPIIFFAFLLPGIAYGIVTGTCRNQRDVVDGLYDGIRTIVPVLVIAFFLAQFAACFEYSRLDQMLAFAGGSLLISADLPVPLLLILFVAFVCLADFAMVGMLAKFGLLAPIFIPMFMMVGISPELTTAAYRIGDSVVNIISPMNSYMLIILAVMQKYRKDAGLGSLLALMVPYSILFYAAWTAFLLAWYFSGIPLGMGAPLHYHPN